MSNEAGRAVGMNEPGSAVESSAPWHAEPIASLYDRLDSTPDGLTETEAQARLEQFGPNALQVAKPVSAWKILVDQFRSVVVILLIVATIAAWVFGDAIEAIAILGVLAINTAIGFISELRARTAMAALLELEVPDATVVRDGTTRVVASNTLVPGDVIVVEAGEAVPADARLIEAAELRADESALTGESMPVDKDAGAALDEDSPLADRANALYMSTAVVAGSGRAVVAATGMSTELGRIGGLVSGIRDERTPLEHRLDALGHRLVWVTLVVAVAVVVVGLLRGDALGRLIETAIALAIAAVPEGLPTVSTITLAVGVARMARRKALVRRLPAVEALGSATIVCTDKTGTLTAGEMTATTLWAGDAEYHVTGTGYRPEGRFERDGRPVDITSIAPLELSLRIGALTNRASLQRDGGDWNIIGDPTEAALLVAAQKAGLERRALLERWPQTGEVPFSSERMLMASFHTEGDAAVAYVKGAPARVLERSARVLMDEGVVALDDTTRARITEQNRAMAARGLRVLALAYGAGDTVRDDALHDLALVGLVGLSDPPAEGVRETIERFHGAGIRTVMITGDQKLTAEAVARELGILRPDDAVVEGRDLPRIAQETPERLTHVSALSRVSPEDKLRIVEALQQRGQIVAMLGDGVNDAAALKKADIGVAMGMRGTDVAKEAASVVLQDDRFQTIGVAIEEGRVIFDNIRRFVFYLFSCNLAEVFVILGASVFGLPAPLLPLQILWLNLITDTFPALSLAAEPGDDNVMRRPPQDPQQAILSRSFLRRVALFALLITTATMGAFLWALNDPGVDRARAVTIAFMTLALAQTFHLGNARGPEPVLQWGRVIGNRWALGATALTIALQLVAVYVPPLASILGVVPLSLGDWALIVPFALMPAVVGQVLALLRTARDAPAAEAAQS